MTKVFRDLIVKRGLTPEFLEPKYFSDGDVFELLPDIKKAISEIKKALKVGKKIMVYGDYDVDGVTATTVMVDALKMAAEKIAKADEAEKIETKKTKAKKTSEIITMLPDRFIDGYGMSERCVERAKKEKVGLVVTVDCGSNNSKVISKLKEAKIKTVVTDHHEIMGELPEAEAVVNPKRVDIPLKEQEKIHEEGLIDLAGVGVAFMVVRGLIKEGLIEDGQEKWLLDLVMIGTLCDSMKLSKMNRVLTFYGLKVLEKTRRPGLRELLRVAKVSRLSSEAIGYQIGPRLNAGGRMESAEISLKLLGAKNRAEAAVLAEELDELNSNRRKEQNEAIAEIVRENGDALRKPVIIVAGKWHEGVLGIIAGRLVERYHKPAFVLSLVSNKDEDGDGISDVYKGSGRSFGDFNLAEAIKACSDVIYSGGGHAEACGVKILPARIVDFIDAMNMYYQGLMLEDQSKYLKVSPEMSVTSLEDFSVELLNELSSLEPYGEGNSEPIFKLIEMLVVKNRRVGKEGNHLRMTVEDSDRNQIILVAFSAPEKWLRIQEGTSVNVVVKILKNEWNGRVTPEGRVIDLSVVEDDELSEDF